jgi:Cft2 family RNA processing exonuclease
VHPKIYRIAKIYEENNLKLGEYVSSDSEQGAEMMKHSFVGVVSPWLLQQHFFESLQMQNNCRSTSCLVTGWNYQRFGVRKIFHLSDHADFQQLMDYVKQSNAKKVYTVHGFEKQFAKAVRKKLGVEALPLKTKQSRLTDFFYSLNTQQV